MTPGNGQIDIVIALTVRVARLNLSANARVAQW
jgi:hypothetical protein